MKSRHFHFQPQLLNLHMGDYVLKVTPHQALFEDSSTSGRAGKGGVRQLARCLGHWQVAVPESCCFSLRHTVLELGTDIGDMVAAL